MTVTFDILAQLLAAVLAMALITLLFLSHPIC